MNDRKKAVHVGTVVLETVKDHLWLSFAILAVVAGAVGAALVPPLVLGLSLIHISEPTRPY